MNFLSDIIKKEENFLVAITTAVISLWLFGTFITGTYYLSGGQRAKPSRQPVTVTEQQEVKDSEKPQVQEKPKNEKDDDIENTAYTCY